MSQVIDVLLIGGRGTIGAGLRTYMPRLDPGYRFVSVDLPGARDKAVEPDVQRDFVDLDIAAEPEALADLAKGRDLVVYLARKGDLATMNRMTDQVFEAVLGQEKPPMMVASSSVHAVDGLYNFYEEGSVYWKMAERNFDDLPERIAAATPAHVANDYGREKEHAERWVRRMAEQGHGAVAARWGGINPTNEVHVPERGYFAVWCHQEDAANFVHAWYRSHLDGSLPAGAHYFVISDNTDNIFDIETPKKEIGYAPKHDSESHF